MIPTLDEHEAADLLARLVAGVPDSPPPLAAVRAEVARRRRRRNGWLAAAVAVLVTVGSGSVAVVLKQSGDAAHDTAHDTATPASPGVASPTGSGGGSPSAIAGSTGPSDPRTLAALQGDWTLSLTNAAPDGQNTTGDWPDFSLTITGNVLETSDGIEAIEGKLVAGPTPPVGEAGDFSVFDLRTASAPPTPGTPTSGPPVLATLQNLGRFERNGNTFLLLTSSAAITAVLRPRQAGVGRVEGTVLTQPALSDDGTGGVRVTLTPTGGGRAVSTTSDGDGGFGLDLPAGSYTVSLDQGTCTPTSPVRVREYVTTQGVWECSGR